MTAPKQYATKRNVAILRDLTDQQKAAVVQLLARVSEESYRRGAQQAVEFSRTLGLPTEAKMCAYRYGVGVHVSSPLDGGFVVDSEAMLMTQYGHHLSALGLWKETRDPFEENRTARGVYQPRVQA